MPHNKSAYDSADQPESAWPNERAAFVVDGYLALWSEADDARRRALVRATWTPDGRFLDPTTDVRGHDELDAMISGARLRLLGRRYHQVGGVDIHHDRLRWGWQLRGPNAAEEAGVNFAVIAPDGRLREVTGFFESPQA